LPNWKFIEILKDNKINFTEKEYKSICKMFADDEKHINYIEFIKKVNSFSKKESLKFKPKNSLKGFYELVKEQEITLK